MANVRQIDLREGQALSFLRFEVLDLRCVTVIIYDNVMHFPAIGQSLAHRSILRFTLAEKRELALMVQNILLFDNESRQVLSAKDRQIFEIEQLLRP